MDTSLLLFEGHTTDLQEKLVMLQMATTLNAAKRSLLVIAFNHASLHEIIQESGDADAVPEARLNASQTLFHPEGKLENSE